MFQNKVISLQKIFVTKALVFIVATFLASNAVAEKDYALLAKRFLTNFQCANFFVEGKIEKHFTAGLGQGREFYVAVRESRIPKEQEGKIPMILGFLLPGPNADFYLGRVWQWAEEDSGEKVDEQCELCDAEGRQNVRRRLYKKNNCDLVL